MNTPAKLARALKKNGGAIRATARTLQINQYYVSRWLKHGEEPNNAEVRKQMGFKPLRKKHDGRSGVTDATRARSMVAEIAERRARLMDTTSAHKFYWIGTATGDKYLEADGHFIGGNYELKIEGQQPYICFYKKSRNNHIGMFVLKNITGWMEINQNQYERKELCSQSAQTIQTTAK